MQQSHLTRRQSSLLPLYERNYMLFRLVLPILPKEDGWFVLEAKEQPSVYVYRLSIHPYTSEWLVGHYFPQKQQYQFSPDFTIRIYHDARLAEALLTENLPIKQVYNRKLGLNRALGEWLDYCHRKRFVLNTESTVTFLPCIKVSP